jgi:hypothetical protein
MISIPLLWGLVLRAQQEPPIYACSWSHIPPRTSWDLLILRLMVAAWYTRTKFLPKSMLIPVSLKNIGRASLESFWSQLQTMLRRYARGAFGDSYAPQVTSL